MPQTKNEKILNEKINNIISDTNKMKQMGENARKIDIENVEEKIYNEIKKVCKI